MKRTISARLFAGLGLTAIALAAHADTLDQVSADGNAGYNVNAASLSWQQQVVTGVAGVLTRIDLFASNTTAAPLQNFRVTINRGSGWQTDADDFSAIVTPVVGMTSINLASANLSFAVGEAFMIGVSGLGPDGNCCVMRGSANPGAYAPGALYLFGSLYNGGGHDFAFNTYVGAVPEPATGLLIAAGLLAVGAAARRRG